MSPEEIILMDILCDFWNKYVHLPHSYKTHEHNNDVLESVHRLQDIIAKISGYREYEHSSKLPIIQKPRPNADVIHAFANGLDVYLKLEFGWVLFRDEYDMPMVGNPRYKWHIGNPEKRK